MMHGWESMSQTTFEHNWCGGMLPIKTEPQTANYPIDTQMHINKPNSLGGSSPNSPPSIDGIDNHNFFFDPQNYNGITNIHRPLGFNPLTPPGYPNAVIPQTTMHQDNTGQDLSHAQQILSSTTFRSFTKTESNNSLTPSHTPPMDVTPPKSPKFLVETPEKDNDNDMNSNFNDSGEDTRSLESDNDDESIRTPKVNSHGKVKKFKCKQCDFIAVTKLSFWDHTKSHIKPEKMLKCLKCPFVTEYKHHLEYHLRNHDGSKPFQCNKCTYSCVNKSMLNSHLKSHSNIYQYRCSDCSYATKYCHSLKLHLRKYGHKPAMVLNEDGTPNPLPIIDVYGTRRGPKMKSSKKLVKQESQANAMLNALGGAVAGAGTGNTAIVDMPAGLHMDSPLTSFHAGSQSRVQQVQQQHQQQQHQHQQHHQQQQQQHQQQLASQHHHQQHPANMMSNLIPNTLANMLQHSGNMSLFPYLNLNLHMLAAQQQAALAQLSPSMRDGVCQSPPKSMSEDEEIESDIECDAVHERLRGSAMDLSQTTPVKSHSNIETESYTSSPTNHNIKEEEKTITRTPTVNSKNHRRKGRAFKLDSIIHNEERQESTLTGAVVAPAATIAAAPSTPTAFQIDNSVRSTTKANGAETATEEPFLSDTSPSALAADSTKESEPKHIEQQFPKTELADRPLSTEASAQKSNNVSTTSSNPENFECKYCGISFKDAVLYTIHMGYHGYNDVFKCNMCGEKCEDRISFFLHIARNSHS